MADNPRQFPGLLIPSASYTNVESVLIGENFRVPNRPESRFRKLAPGIVLTVDCTVFSSGNLVPFIEIDNAGITPEGTAWIPFHQFSSITGTGLYHFAIGENEITGGPYTDFVARALPMALYRISMSHVAVSHTYSLSGSFIY